MPPKLKELFDLDREIQATEKHLRAVKEMRECTLAGILSARIGEQNGYQLLAKERQVRIPDPLKFCEKFPTLLPGIIKIELRKADLALGRGVVDGLCDIQRTYIYRVEETGAHE
jgi:hypothetical protein